MKVMIVDNDAAWTRSLEILLGRRGYHTKAFIDPEAACSFVEQATDEQAPEALILDYAMPRMNGLELLDRVRGHLNSGCRVVLLTGHGDRVRDSDLQWKGRSFYMEKPVDLDRLDQALTGDGNESEGA